ncbi:MAG: aryl-sulfate sulfotransferase [Pseudomonadota bacterium]
MSTFISYTYDEHLITIQNKAEKAFLEAFEADKPCLENAHVLVNPYLINPLAALILFKTDENVSVTMTLHGKNNARENIVKSFPEATSHAIPIIGLYENISNTVTLELSNGHKKEFSITGQPLPKDVCRCRNVMTSWEYFGNDFMFLTPAEKNLPSAYDYQGNVRWLLNIYTMFDIKRLANGNILTGTNRYSRMPYNATGLYELNLLGKIFHEYRMPGNYHHDQFELADGNLMVLTQDFSAESSTVEDMIALLDRKTGDVLRTWDFKDFLPQNVAGSGSQDAHDWFHCNALWVNEENKTILLSGRHQDAIVNFSYEENDGKGKLNWIIGDPQGWPQDMVDTYFFTPVGDVENFDWQYEQHACLMCPDGDVMAFDNGHYRSKNKDNYRKNKDNFSRGVRYHIDTEKMEIEQVWQFGKEWGQNFFSPYICNVEYYADGHYLVHSGGMGTIDGFASEQLPSYLDDSKDGIDVFSRTIEERNGVMEFFLEVEGNFYRAEKLSPYHDNDNAAFGEGSLLGELDITPTFDTIPDVEEVMQVVPLECELSVAEEEDKLIMKGTFERGQLVMYVLEGAETHGYFINTAAVDYLAMCSGAFLEEDDRTNRFSISKRGLSGRYDIKVIINDTKYQTGISIFC